MVHRAFFQVPDAPECFFIKVTNLSSSREIEVTHIWFAAEPRVDVLNQERRLPARLRLDETFETWIPVSAVPAVRHVGSKVRVRLSNGKVIKSKLDKHIPPLGYVAGPGSRWESCPKHWLLHGQLGAACKDKRRPVVIMRAAAAITAMAISCLLPLAARPGAPGACGHARLACDLRK